MTKVLTQNEAKKAFWYYFDSNGDYQYTTENGFCHLIRNGTDLLEGKKAIYLHSYANGDYEYQANDGFCHLIRNGVDLLEGKKAIDCDPSSNEYQTENGFYHKISLDI